MAFLPDCEYQGTIEQVQDHMTEQGDAELHIFIGNGPNRIVYKMKSSTAEEAKRSAKLLLKFGCTREQLASETFVENISSVLCGKEVWFKTKQWEMNGRTGVYVKALQDEPFAPAAKVLAKQFGKLFANEAASPRPLSLEITDDDVAF